MDIDWLKKAFFKLVAPDVPNDWDVEERLEPLLDIDEEQCREIFKYIPTIWPVSNALCYDYLDQANNIIACLHPRQLGQWVNETLDRYEIDGLRAAQLFMINIEHNFLSRLRGEDGLQFEKILGRLLPYARGLSGTDLDLKPSKIIYTDTSTLFLPEAIRIFRLEEPNFLLYKLIVSYQWGFIANGSYTVVPPGFCQQRESLEKSDVSSPLEDFFLSFPQPKLARDIYHLVETVRITTFLEKELPGLMRDTRKVRGKCIHALTSADPTARIFFSLQQFILGNDECGSSPEIRQVLRIISDRKNSALTSVTITQELYNILELKEKKYNPVVPLLFQGEMRLRQVEIARMQQREERKEVFIDALTTHLLVLPPATDTDELAVADGTQEDDIADTGTGDQALVVQQDKQSNEGLKENTPVFITINNREIEFNDELKELASRIISDIGFLPDRYIQSAAGRAGGSSAGRTVFSQNNDGEVLRGLRLYNEWDYRRNGFRKNWCRLKEKEIPLVKSTFIDSTLKKYHGQILRLQRQFEMMRTRERFVRRQRDGDEIDFDALVDSMSDARAGLAASDNLYIRLQRDQRDIAALFLVDMSNSTEGWVGTAIKEALVLLCESLEILGDRYAIYGFSGMRRLRCEMFHVKHFDESYSTEVKTRIGSIFPSEYTRMGPAIRHATEILRQTDAKLRLLIILSDGKPEDYDDYKGEYAIEDTRHALIEARVASVHPFCITIDDHAHDYMAHLFGDVNYIFIDDVRKLPAKMPEIYRNLTT